MISNRTEFAKRLAPVYARKGVIITILLLGLLVAGPRAVPRMPVVRIPEVPADPASLMRLIGQQEAADAPLRPDNEARIVWANPDAPARTDCAIVYLHGFTASQGEGSALARSLANDFGCNLYLSRLPGHGEDAPDAMAGLNAQKLTDGAARALGIARALGKHIIVIGTSMGGSLGLILTAQAPTDIKALVLWSPLVRERYHALIPFLLPWGAEITRLVRNSGSAVRHKKSRSPVWASDIHVDGYVTLAELTRGALRKKLFNSIKTPTFVGYYYRDPAHQDETVSVDAIRKMFDELATPDDKKRLVDFPNAGNHIIPYPGLSHASDDVLTETRRFLHDTAGLPFSRAIDDIAVKKNHVSQLSGQSE